MRSFYSTTMRHHHRRCVTTTAFALLFLASSASASTTISSATHHHQLGSVGKEEREGDDGWLQGVVSRRRLGGPGSAPPSCKSKCGKCTPCRAVHVPIHPGRIMPLEYYPEAWRCKCGKKLFMP